MKINFLVTLDWDPNQRLDMTALVVDIRDALWEIQPNRPIDAIEVTHIPPVVPDTTALEKYLEDHAEELVEGPEEERQELIEAAKEDTRKRRNRAKCRKCGDIIESKRRHDFQRCKCGAICVDGGDDYHKRSGYPEDIEEMP